MNQAENMSTIEIEQRYYAELKRHPLFFIHKNENYSKYSPDPWTINDKRILPYISADISQRSHELVIVETNQNILPQSEHDTIKLPIHRFSENNINDWSIVFNSYLARMHDSSDKYSFIALLWCINQYLPESTIIKTIRQYDLKVQPCLTHILKEIAVCLSVPKQQILQNILTQFDIDYNIYTPQTLLDALSVLVPNLNYLTSDCNLFDAIDTIFNEYTNDYNPFEGDNLLLSLHVWLSDSTFSFTDYEGLKRWFALFSDRLKLKIIKRYFYDIHLGITLYDEELINSFKNNHFQKFSYFRYCIKTPNTPIKLTVPLLCDCITTLLQTKGETLQTFNGVLDMAIINSDRVAPNIDVGLKNLLPICNGGVKYNHEFDGFIYYEFIYNLNEKKLHPQTLKDVIGKLLNRYAKQKYDYICEYDGSLLSESQIFECKKNNLQCLKIRYNDIWKVNDRQNISILSLFLIKIPHVINYDTEIKWEDISIDLFKENIKKLAESWGEHVEHGYILKKIENSWQKDIIDIFYDKTYIRIHPRNDAVLNPIFNLFRFSENDYQKESQELKERIIQSLTRELKTNISSENYFEIPYDFSQLEALKKLYYCNNSNNNESIRKEHDEFLVKFYPPKYTKFCAPELSPQLHIATNLSYFWCHGKECFYNNLEKQTLEESPSWQQYSLFHILEILGYPKLRKTEAGNEPDSIIRQFIGLVNRALAKFQRLTCRSCGHLIFIHKNGSFNRYNYYSCINPACSEYKRPVYLNYCYHCKTGLIDSRDTKQCPNGWYICSNCLACCDDELYYKQAQRYVLAKKTIPLKLQSKAEQGHNDKGIFFCPNCGLQVSLKDKNSNTSIYHCDSCKKEFNIPQ